MKTQFPFLRFGVFAAILTIATLSPAATVTYVLQDANFPVQFNSGGDFFNSGGATLGMWANTGSKQTAAWRTFKTAGDNTGSNRSLQVGDVFKITVSATRAFGQIGFSLNSGGTQGSSYGNRTSGSRLYFNTDNYAAWYVNRSGGNSSLSYVPLENTYKDYIFTVRITSETTADVFLTVDGVNYRAYNLTMNGTAGVNIDAFSIYGADMWDGSSNDDAFWKQTCTVENTGRVELGYFLTSGTYNPGKVTDGLAADSTSSASVNAVHVGGDAGSAVVLDDDNTFTGSVTVNANATARLQHANGFGTTAGGVSVTSGGKIEISGGITVGAEALSLSGTGISTSGALQNTSGDNIWQGNVTLPGNATVAVDAGSLTLGGSVDFQNPSGGVDRALTIAGAGDTTIPGDFINAATGGSSLTKTGNGTLTLSGNNALRVLYNHGGGVISISSAANIGIPLGVNYPDKFNFTANATLRSTNNITLGRQVSGTDNAGFRINGGSTATFEVLADSTLSIDGVIAQYGTGNGSLTKTGNGTLSLLASNTYAGTTTITAGTLIGTGSLAGPLSINAGGTLAPGTSIGTLTVNNTVTLAGTTALEVNKAAGPALTSDLVTGITTLNCGGAVTVTATGNPLAAGDEFTVFSATTYNGSFTSISPAPGAGLAWDTNALPTLGKLRVHTIPVAVSNAASVAQGRSATLAATKLLANDSDADNDTLTIVSASAVSGSASVSGGNVNYTAPLTGTSDTITYTISDGRGGTASAAIHVTLTPGTSQGFNQLALEPLGGGSVRLTYLGIPGTNYALDWRTNLSLGDWTPVITNPAAANGQLVFTNTSSAPENYFRTRYVP